MYNKDNHNVNNYIIFINKNINNKVNNVNLCRKSTIEHQKNVIFRETFYTPLNNYFKIEILKNSLYYGINNNIGTRNTW